MADYASELDDFVRALNDCIADDHHFHRCPDNVIRAHHDSSCDYDHRRAHHDGRDRSLDDLPCWARLWARLCSVL